MWQTHDVDTLIDQRDQLLTERDELQQLWQAETRKADELRRQRDKALQALREYGWIDGAHHKQWVLDQVLRRLAGEDYENIVQTIDGWNTGVAP